MKTNLYRIEQNYLIQQADVITLKLMLLKRIPHMGDTESLNVSPKGQKRTETDRNGQKLTKTDINGQKRQKQTVKTETDRN